MNFLEYAKKNGLGLTFIDRIRYTLKDFCSSGMREEFKDVSEEDIDKLYLMIENNFFSGITSDDSEWDIKTISVDDVKFLIGSSIGMHSLLRGVEKNKRESYSELLWDITDVAIDCIENIDEACEFSDEIKKYYQINHGEYEGDYNDTCDEEMFETLAQVYRFMLKDIIEI